MTTTALATLPDATLIERVLLHGDLRQLTPAQKVSYYRSVCESVGLNPLTQPFQYLVLSGKEVLYARRDATEQLRKIHTVSIQIMAREVMEDCYIVTARATLPNGRQDENIGAVPIQGLKGEARANAMMKAETKAKRRVTLAICGLGMLDETEVESIQSEAPALPEKRENPVAVLGGTHGTSSASVASAPGSPADGDLHPSAPNGEASGTTSSREPGSDDGPDLEVDLPPGARFIYGVRQPGPHGAACEITFTDGEVYLSWNKNLAPQAHDWCAKRVPVVPDFKRSQAGNTRIETLVPLPLIGQAF